ncbi:hypothetical protein B0T26DRAFT_676751 [Lasiosphaeria miniovina]|uniref:Amidoligase enzyme n=1 Tax=Lasiosphaeria miniovina TaxID=1954250 RepID=A0AA40DWX0_9PEZI|nr:uncharacterized protein B0T26DRAFT_676751 [Lasiosphaeria miniovina]KAK0718610.1 hypothetical protein B0T26DRAFT_676751 [Lasiosphaeria miniovina]
MANPVPVWGSEHEILLELKENRATELREWAFTHNDVLPAPFQGWDFTLKSDADDATKKEAKVTQRNRLRRAVRHILEEAGVPMDDGQAAYGGWSVVDDESLDEQQATPTKFFWRVEIVSRPIRADEFWEDEMELVYQTLASWFNIFVNNSCSMHVHVTPGTSGTHPFYSKEQLASVACGTCYWEHPLFTIMPKDRKDNSYAVPNTKHIPKLKARYDEFYAAGSTKTWSHVYGPFLSAKSRSLLHVVDLMYGNKDRVKPEGKPKSDYNKYMSTNFCNVQASCGTVELRRQGGASSHEQAIKQVIFALCMHVSILATDWAAKGATTTKPTAQQFITELVAAMGRLPVQSHHDKFQSWLEAMHEKNHNLQPSQLSSAEVQKINAVQQKNLYDLSAFATVGIHSRPGTPVTPSASLPVPSQFAINYEANPWDNPWV